VEDEIIKSTKSKKQEAKSSSSGSEKSASTSSSGKDSKPSTKKKNISDSKSSQETKKVAAKKKASTNESKEPKSEEHDDNADKDAPVTSKKKEITTKEYQHAYEDPNWEGNEDETGSVDSGVMEEDFCFECGISTLANADEWNNVILCDRCDAEYHLKCVGLEVVPRREYICRKCVSEVENMKDLKFDVGEKFKVSFSPLLKYFELKGLLCTSVFCF
jgi:hypothetical protein